MKRSAAIGLSCGLLAACVANAQTFNRVIGLNGNETANGVAHTRDGGYVTVGTIAEPPPTADRADILVVKYDDLGNVQWVSRFGGQGTDIGYSVQQTRDGGYIVGAETDSNGPLVNLALLRLDPAGGYMWSWVYEGDLSGEDGVYAAGGCGVAAREAQEGFVLTGRKRISQTNQAGVLVSTAPNGAPLWNLRYIDPRFGERTMMGFADVKVDTNGTYVVVGTEQTGGIGSANPDLDPILLRITPAGAPMWARNYRMFVANPNSVEHASGDGLDICRNGDIVFDGRSDLGNAGTVNLQATRTDANGNLRWSQAHLRLGSSFRSIREDERLTIAAGGWAGPSSASNAMLLVMAPATGLAVFNRQYDYMPVANGMVDTPLTPGYVLCGNTVFPTSLGFGNQDIELIKTDPAGFVGCLDQTIETPSVRPSVEPPLFQPLPTPQAATFWQGEFRRWQLRDEHLCRPCPTCPADFNQDGGVDGSDVSDFYDAWSLGLPCADVNQDGGVDGSDVGYFFHFWQAGGC